MAHRRQNLRTSLLASLTIALSSCSGYRLPPDDSARAAGFVDVTEVVDVIVLDIRYAGENNFIGKPIDGYTAPVCLLHRDAAAGLARAAKAARDMSLRLKLFDCYRPQRAVSHFMRWAEDPSSVRNKNRYYPEIEKSDLIGPYIAARSGHSRGATVDLTLVRLSSSGDWEELDMGGSYDFFDPISNTDDPRITDVQRANRYLLRNLMSAAGFAPYDMEWWHFTFRPEPHPDTYFDFIVR